MEGRNFAALYCRISKNISNHDESDSITNQKLLVQRAAVQHGYEHTQLFVDDGYSGTVFPIDRSPPDDGAGVSAGLDKRSGIRYAEKDKEMAGKGQKRNKMQSKRLPGA